MLTLCCVLAVHLIFGLLVMDYLCPFWHPFERLCGAMIWPVFLAVFIGSEIRDAVSSRRRRAIEAHTVFHLKAQIAYMDVCDGRRKWICE